MKKYLIVKKIFFIVIISFCINIFYGCTSFNTNESKQSDSRILNYDEVKDSLIRFHVIANSDTEEDQKLKLEVKDKVINYLYPYLNSSKSLDESRQTIENNMDAVKKIAEDVIKDNKYNYSVKVQLDRENFPDKSYGNIVLPQGNYEAFRIIIGNGQGKNWWCVMFPPLCFVDESKAEVEYDKTEERIKAEEKKTDSIWNLNFGANKTDNQDKLNNQSNGNNIRMKFKIVEIFKNIFNCE